MATTAAMLCLLKTALLLQLCFLPKVLTSSKSCGNENNKITSLPGQPSVDFQQFAGYIPVDEQKQRALFYYFVEAETDPISKPLVLFLSGGPGVSSVALEGFAGNGPFRPSGKGLVRNKYSWNKEANMLYVDSPAGVGFSYSVNKSFYASLNDEITARDNLRFLQGWLKRYPEYKSRDLFLTGVSYSGHFITQLANLLLHSNLKPNLKGISVAGPLLEFNLDFNSKAQYLWSHGLISDSTFDSLNKLCNFSQITRQTLSSGKLSPVCSQVNSLVYSEIGEYISPFDISAGVCLLPNNASSQTQASKVGDVSDGSPDLCIYEKVITYFRRKDVQKALNAKLVGVDQWYLYPGQQPEEDRLFRYDPRDAEQPILPILATLVKSGIRVVIFSGDQDPIIPFTATRIHINTLANELGLNTTVPYQSWLQGTQVGGWTQAYGDVLLFTTIRGAGHEPMHSQPERSLTVFTKFLQGKSLP